MRFHFEAQQDYQIAAVEAVAGLFEGQPRVEPDLLFSLGSALLAAIPNRLDLNEAQLVENLQSVQGLHELPADEALQYLEETIESAEGTKTVRFPNFSVEM